MDLILYFTPPEIKKTVGSLRAEFNCNIPRWCIIENIYLSRLICNADQGSFCFTGSMKLPVQITCNAIPERDHQLYSRIGNDKLQVICCQLSAAFKNKDLADVCPQYRIRWYDLNVHAHTRCYWLVSS